MLNTMMKLDNEPAFYFPPASGRYEVSAGLSPLTRDFGNGLVDQKIFQFDLTFPIYRENKLTCREECLSKFYIEKDFSTEAQRDVNQYLIEQLCREHPDKFSRRSYGDSFELKCFLTNEHLIFDTQYNLLQMEDSNTSIPYTSTLDAIASQIQEDISVVQLTPEGHDYIAALHLCSPNHWSAENKIGQSFTAAHKTVPHMGKLNRQSQKLLESLAKGGPYVRFAWGVATDERLNHHPNAPAGSNNALWYGRHFEITQPKLWLRVERQILTTPRGSNTVIFLIRTYLYDVSLLQKENVMRLAAAIQSMSNESLNYKSLQHNKKDILNWLQKITNNSIC